MVSIEEAEVMLNEIAEELPKEFYNKLNGGILLRPEVKMHPQSVGQGLYIMGQYHHNRNMGRYIEIYYGSFEKLYGYLEPEEFKERLRKTLIHEFTHHIESLAGDHSLEVKDAINLAEYKKIGH